MKRKSNIVKFPTARIVEKRILLCGYTDEMQAIDQALRSVMAAQEALRRQHHSLILRYRAAADRAIEERRAGR